MEQGNIQPAQAFQQWEVLDWYRQTGGRLPAHWRDALGRDPEMTRVVMVVDLYFGGPGGKRLRVATVPLTTVDANGVDHSALPLLIEEPEISNEYQLGEATSAARSVAMTIDARYVDPAALIKNGLPLSGIGEVALESLEIADYDRRYVLIRGDMSGGVAFGAYTEDGSQREVVELEIVDPRDSVATKLPPWVIDLGRFSTAHKSAIGERIPIIVNEYGDIPAVRVTSVTPGLQTFIFAHGATGWAVDTTTGVKVNGVVKAAADATYPWTVLEAIDVKGTPYTAIRFTNAATAWPDNDSVHVTAVHSTQDTSVVGAMREVLERYTPIGLQGANVELFSAAEAGMPGDLPRPRIIINGSSGGSASTAIEWVEEGYLSSFPMLSMVWRGGGYGPVLTDFRRKPIARWVSGQAPLYDRVSLVQEVPRGAIFNEFVLRYGYDPVLDLFTKVAVRGASNSAVCQYSRQLFGERHADAIESLSIYDDELATYVLDWCVAHKALPSYYLEYEGPGDTFLRYRRGDTIQLVDPEFSWVDEPATIERLEYRRGRTLVGLRVWVRYMDLGGAAFSAGL